MNLKKIIILPILLTMFPSYLLSASAGKNIFIQPLVTTSAKYLPKTSYKTLLPSSSFSKFTIPTTTTALVPKTQYHSQVTLLAQGINPKYALMYRTLEEIEQKTINIKTLSRRDSEWLPKQLKELNTLYNQFIQDSLQAENFSSWNKNSMYTQLSTITVRLEEKLKKFNDIKQILKNDYKDTQDIDNYIDTTTSTIESIKAMRNRLFFDEPEEVIDSPAIQKRIESILKESKSPNDVLDKLYVLLNSQEYKTLKEYHQEITDHLIKNRRNIFDAENRKKAAYEIATRDFSDKNINDPYSGLEDEVKATGKSGLKGTAIIVGGAGATGEYIRRKFTTQEKQALQEKKAGKSNEQRNEERVHFK